MMDGRVAAIRSALDREGFTHVSIMSYTAKCALTTFLLQMYLALQFITQSFTSGAVLLSVAKHLKVC